MKLRDKLKEVVIAETIDTPDVARVIDRLWDETLDDEEIDQTEYNAVLFAMYRGIHAALMTLADHVDRLEAGRR